MSKKTLPPPELFEHSLYDMMAWLEWLYWRSSLHKKPKALASKAAWLQEKINKIIPEKVHEVVTAAIKKLTHMLLDGSGFFQPIPPAYLSLEEKEQKVRSIIRKAALTAAAEGGATGAGGILLGMVDFPALMAIKVKMLYSICANYGYDAHKPEERMFMLRIFQLAFSAKIYLQHNLAALEGWPSNMPANDPFSTFDWKSFQIQYRDFIDLMKLAQLIPLAGAPVGVLANNYLVYTLGQYAMMAYRMRYFREMSR